MRAPRACTALLALLLAGCGDAGGFAADEWGPLAVVDAAGPGDDAVISGTIRIDGGCVSLEAADGARTLLVWPRGGTAWTGEAIEFWAGGSESWTLREGDQLTFAGGGSRTAEDGLDAVAFLEGVVWIAAPDPGCVTESRWFVAGIVGG